MNTTRRSLLRSIAGGALGVAGTQILGGHPVLRAAGLLGTSIVGNPLRVPPTFTGDELVAGAHTQAIWPGHETTVWTLGGSWPGPTIRVRKGDLFSVRLRNELDEETIVHWHGQIIPHDMDGHPMDAIAPGETFDYAFEVLNRAGTYFYHPHPHERTAPQAYKGMGGFFLVTDDEEESLGLPSGAFDVPLMVQDRIVTPDFQLVYDPTPTERLNGYFGNAVLVNGTPDAYLNVSADLYRFRILNGCNGRLIKIGFESGRPFHVIGTDGGLLDKPYEIESAFLGPAERLEILVDFSDMSVGESLRLMTLGFNGATTYRQLGFVMPIIRFDVTSPAAKQGTIPETLIPTERIDPAEAARTRVWELQTTPIPRDGHFHHINNRIFDMHRTDVQVRAGETEIWEIRNTHSMPHPIHIHGVQFQVLERIDGHAIEPRDLGWKDTIEIWGYETVRVIMRFAPYGGTYLFHCHNLEHEDGGMMLNYEIGDIVSGVGEEEKRRGRRLDLS